MTLPEEAILLRVFTGEARRYEGKPLYEQVVLRARALGMAGATVLRGPLGFGASSRLHAAKVLSLSEDLPIVIEIVDREEQIQKFLPLLDKMLAGGLVTMEKVKVLHYRADSKGG